MTLRFSWLLLSLSAAVIPGWAQAGGAGTPPLIPVQVGQVWHLTAQPAVGQPVMATLQVGRELPPVMSIARTFGLISPGAGGDLYFSPPDRGLALSLVYGKDRIYRCFTLWPVGTRQASGVLLSGSVERTNDQLAQAQRGTDDGFPSLMAGMRRSGAGTCTITLR